MQTSFGVSSKIPSNTPLKNGYTIYDWVMRQKGFPDFWGRQISGENAVTKNELEFLKEKNCPVCLLFDDFTEAQISGNNGTKDGDRAADAAKALGVPRGVGIVIYADINPEWSINHNWMLGFAASVVNAGYCVGFIGNTDSSKNFNFDRQSSHYVQSVRFRKHLAASFGATEPKVEGEVKAWKPYCPSGINTEDIDLWRCGTVTFDLLTVDTVLAKDEEVLKKFWNLNQKGKLLWTKSSIII